MTETDPLQHAIELVKDMQAEEEALKRTVSVERKLFDHKIDIQDKEYTNTWNSCCGLKSDSRLVRFISILIITMIVLLFSCFQLTRNLDCSNQNLYVGLITLTIGIWLKSPVN
jgi:hypothetical protein